MKSEMSEVDKKRKEGHPPLPSNHWMFDIDDGEDDSHNLVDENGRLIQKQSLLEELEIDPKLIYRSVTLLVDWVE